MGDKQVEMTGDRPPIFKLIQMTDFLILFLHAFD